MWAMSTSARISPSRALRRKQKRYLAVSVAVSALCLVSDVVGLPALAGASGDSSRPYFAAAKVLWESEAEDVSGALQNVPLVAAVADLERGLDSGHGDVAGYAGAVATIRNFESIPLTSESPAQMKKARSDWSELNAFFNIGPAQAAVLMDFTPKGAYYDIAQRTFMGEPQRNRSGVNTNLLKLAATDLVDESQKQPTRAVLYVAAIYDLKNLEGASARDIAASASSLTNPYGQDILYLNVFFQTSQLVGSGSTDMAEVGK
jgi:hypothetical protein